MRDINVLPCSFWTFSFCWAYRRDCPCPWRRRSQGWGRRRWQTRGRSRPPTRGRAEMRAFPGRSQQGWRLNPAPTGRFFIFFNLHNFGYRSTIFKDVVTTYKRWFPVCRWSRSIRFSLRQDEAWRSEPFLEEIFVFLYVTAIGSKLSVKALRTGWCILYSFLRV